MREILCVLSDETATVVRERALADSEELFRSAFSGAPIGIALSDFDGRLLRVNPTRWPCSWAAPPRAARR